MANISLRRRPESTEPAAPSRAFPSHGRWEPFRWMDDFFNWDPFREMAPMLGPPRLAFSPDFEIVENPDSYVFRADVPGIAESDLDISVSGNQLTVSGKREQEQTTENANYYCCERSYGSFNRMFTLPQGTDMEHISADVKNGVLTIRVPKSPETQPRKIQLGAGGVREGKGARA